VLDQRVVTDIGQDQQPTIEDLPGQACSFRDRDERVAVAGDDQRRSPVVRRGCSAISVTIASSNRRQLPGP